MTLVAGVLVLVGLVLVVYGVLSVVTTPADQVQHLPRPAWLLLVVLLPVVGTITWLRNGRRPGTGSALLPAAVPAPGERPGRARAVSPDDDAAFLRQLRDRADAQRAEAQRLRRAAGEHDAGRERPPDEPAA